MMQFVSYADDYLRETSQFKLSIHNGKIQDSQLHSSRLI